MHSQEAKREKVLVTGGAGYVGSILIPKLLHDGYAVCVLDNLMYRQHTVLPFFIEKNFSFIKGDVRDRETVTRALDGADYIVHLAAVVGEPACKRDPKLCYELNQHATEQLNALLDRSQKLLFASTGSVYGKVGGLCTENTALNPVSHYGISKMKAEEAVRKRSNYIIYRFATAFGLSPRLRLDLLPNDFVYRALKQRANIVYEAHFKRTFIHVVDMARSFVYGIKNFTRMKDQVYNVGSEKMNFTKKDIAQKIAEKVPHYLHFADFGTDPDQRNYEVSYAKMRNTGFDVAVDLDQGIAELISGYETVHISNPFSNVE